MFLRSRGMAGWRPVRRWRWSRRRRERRRSPAPPKPGGGRAPTGRVGGGGEGGVVRKGEEGGRGRVVGGRAAARSPPAVGCGGGRRWRWRAASRGGREVAKSYGVRKDEGDEVGGAHDGVVRLVGCGRPSLNVYRESPLRLARSVGPGPSLNNLCPSPSPKPTAATAPPSSSLPSRSFSPGPRIAKPSQSPLLRLNRSAPPPSQSASAASFPQTNPPLLQL